MCDRIVTPDVGGCDMGREGVSDLPSQCMKRTHDVYLCVYLCVCVSLSLCNFGLSLCICIEILSYTY